MPDQTDQPSKSEADAEVLAPAEEVADAVEHEKSGPSEDWLAIELAFRIFALVLVATFLASASGVISNPLAPFFGKPGTWSNDPLTSLIGGPEFGGLVGIVGSFVTLLALFGFGTAQLGIPWRRFEFAFVAVFGLATFAYVLAGQEAVKFYSLSYPLWALVIGLLISNTIGTPRWIKPAVMVEFYTKTGLVLLGAEVLLSRLFALGQPGIVVAWVVTPIVLISTYIFGQKVLKIRSKSLNMVISADMSVCGVSAAIATAAACNAKKEELSLAIGISLIFTVIMMVILPPVIVWLDLGPVVGGAWIGGTIDSTGAVAAAGGILGDTALAVAATVKMIQNILIGAVAFGVAVYWTTYVERNPDGPQPSLREVWIRFPKFVLGFLGASAIFTTIYITEGGSEIVDAIIAGTTKTLRGWCFCLAFVSIGLETNFRELGRYLHGGKPLILYVCGQSLNILLTLFMAWLMYTQIFPDAAAELMESAAK
ncbi:YeiH family protein [Stratiformator vulcanicus]|uniref:Sulfate exporter family transporter n=1 Tax=Stratiformator vulcanicus TaxID=2527980 RepID=A0A517QYZ5_9PLAN|nr:putative sulfate exporter family transporter [Stratiformator vulcanicus]QDT36824.1 hypothetical protein Pan189_11870 [Stratiformator vulcanicus]